MDKQLAQIVSMTITADITDIIRKSHLPNDMYIDYSRRKLKELLNYIEINTNSGDLLKEEEDK